MWEKERVKQRCWLLIVRMCFCYEKYKMLMGEWESVSREVRFVTVLESSIELLFLFY